MTMRSLKHIHINPYQDLPQVHNSRTHLTASNLNMELLKQKSVKDFIPCLLLKYQSGSSKILLYFHANAEDLGRAERFLDYIYTYHKMHIIAVEYPGYGIYNGDSPSADKIVQDADIVYKFLTRQLNWKEQDIIVCGRSIGSGPACYLASRYQPSCLILISPHTSIRGIVRDRFLGSVA